MTARNRQPNKYQGGLTLSARVHSIIGDMKVGSRGDYGLRALTYLASQKHTGKPTQIHAIAERQQIPEDYLRQLLVQLRAAGLVRSVRGPHGGYLLAKESTEISMAEVLHVLEGPPEILTFQFNENDADNPNHVYGGCKMWQRWQEAVTRMTDVLANTTLSDLCDQT